MKTKKQHTKTYGMQLKQWGKGRIYNVMSLHFKKEEKFSRTMI